MNPAPRLARATASFLTVLLCASLAGYASLQADAQAVPEPQPAASPAPKAKEAPHARPAPDGSPVEVSATLDKAKRNVRVVVTAVESLPASVLALYRYQGAEENKSSRSSKTSLPALTAGRRVVRTLAVGEPLVGDVGLSPAVEVRGQTAGSGFIALRANGGSVVTAETMSGLDDAELEADHHAGRLTDREFRRRAIELRAVPGSERSVVTHDPRLTAGDVTVSGRAQYRFRDSSSSSDLLPARGALVRLRNTQTGELGPTARVAGNGDFRIVGAIPRNGDEWVVEMTADAGVAVVYDPSQSGYYTVTSIDKMVLNSGSTWTQANLTLKVETDEARAFAILDAAKTVGDFYSDHRRSGWASTLTLSYPHTKSSTDRLTNLIKIEGGIALHCGDKMCEEDAFDWNVVAHEAGHVVANESGMNDSPGGSHTICDDAWDGRSKEDAAKLAWSEGWATFWGMVALRDEGVPSGYPAEVVDVNYDDRTGPPYFEGSSISYSLESRGECEGEARGNTSEYAVQMALWDFWDSGSDHGETVDLTTDAIFDRLWDAHPKTFWDAWGAVSAGWTTGQRRAAQIILSENGFAPTILSPDGAPTYRCPPRIRWGHGGSMLNPNTYLTMRVTSPTGTLLKSVVVNSPGQTTYSYPIGLTDWKNWSSNYGSVWIEIDGRQMDTPNLGPYRSGAQQVWLVNPPNTGGCVIETDWTEKNWWTDFAAPTQARLRPDPQIDFAGHPLDVTFDNTGAVWGIGEFGLQATRTSAAGALSRHNLPIKVYLKGDTDDPGDQPDIWDWTKPFSSWLFSYSSGSDLAESVVDTGSSVWAAYGGEQDGTESENHSILARYPTDDPHNFWKWCAVPLPGDNNEVIGLAYDSNRGRVWFAESEGDHRQGAGKYTTIGWIKESGLGSRCQNELDFGGDKRLSPERNAELRASAQQTVNSLQCTAAQQSDPDANCVHIIAGTGVGPGGTHIEYDPYSDALWMTNWCDRKLRKFTISSGTWSAPIEPPEPTRPPNPGSVCPFGTAWQVAVNSTHVFFNEYEGNRILRFTKTTGEWSIIDIPVSYFHLQTHSIKLSGDKLWFTVSDEDYNSATRIGYIDVSTWNSGAKAVLYSGWSSLAMHPNVLDGKKHSFRGLDVGPGGRIALADHGDMATVILTPK